MLDPEEERRYEELRRLGQELHIPIPEAFWELEVRDKNGKVIQRHRQRSHSWVRNAYNFIFTNLAAKDADDTTFGAGKLSLKDTGGTVQHDDYPFTYGEYSVDGVGGAYPGLRGAAGDDTEGIVVGSGTNAENFEDYALQTKIANGVGAGQLSYVQSDAHVITWTAGTLTLKNELVRYFNNNSGGSIDVNEVGLYCRVVEPGGSPKFLITRDLLASTVTLPDTGQLKVTYTIQLTYPA